jgi:hypothetical protein
MKFKIIINIALVYFIVGCQNITDSSFGAFKVQDDFTQELREKDSLAVDQSKSQVDQINLNFHNQIKVETGKSSAKFKGEDLNFLNPTGAPNLPSRVFKALLPPDVDFNSIEVSLENIKTSPIENIEIEPVSPMSTWDQETGQEKVIWPKGEEAYENGCDKEIYKNDALFPANIFEARKFSLGAIRNWQIIEVPVAIFQYNPVKKNLVKIESFNLVIDFDLLDEKTRAKKNHQVDDLGEKRVKELVENFSDFSTLYQARKRSTSRASSLSTYLILTTEAIKNASTELKNFALNKADDQGDVFKVELVTESNLYHIAEGNFEEIASSGWGGGIGDEAAENIRNWLKEDDRYLSRNIEYVLLIGNPHPDEGDVPMKKLWPRSCLSETDEHYEDKESLSDFYYADMNGNWDLDDDGRYGECGEFSSISNGDFGDKNGEKGIDINYDIIIGRIPYYGELNDLDHILKKSILYENSTDRSWRNNILLPMSSVNMDSENYYYLGERIKNDLNSHIANYFRIYDDDHGLNPYPEVICTRYSSVLETWRNNKFGVVTWFTHGLPEDATNIMTSSNVVDLNDEYPSFVFQVSCNNAYPENNNNLSYSLLRNGAVNTIGATRSAYPGSSEDMSYGYVKGIMQEKQTSGESLFNFKQEQKINAVQGNTWVNYTVFNLYGDPSLKLNSPGIVVPEIEVELDKYYFDPSKIDTLEDRIIKVNFTAKNYEHIAASSTNKKLVPNENITFKKLEEDEMQANIQLNNINEKGSKITLIVTSAGGSVRKKEFFIIKTIPTNLKIENLIISLREAALKKDFNIYFKVEGADQLKMTTNSSNENFISSDNIAVNSLGDNIFQAKIILNNASVENKTTVFIESIDEYERSIVIAFDVVLKKSLFVSKNQGDFDTIQKAINEAKEGDVIYVTSATYEENLKINFKNNIRIVGAPGRVIICGDQNRSDSIFNIESSSVIIDHIDITNGSSTYGGGISAFESSINIINSNIYNNTSSFGGGIYSYNYCEETSSLGQDSVLKIVNSNIDGNTAISGGGVYYDVRVFTEYGYNIGKDSSFFMFGGSITNNTAEKFGGGLYNGNSEKSDIINSKIGKNVAGDEGGGIYNVKDVRIINSSIYKNIANWGGGICGDIHGAIKIISSDISANTATDEGGGIFNWGDLIVNYSSIYKNKSKYIGGGIDNYGKAIVTESNIYNNTGSHGAGVFSSNSFTITDSNIYGNTTSVFFSRGGGIENQIDMVVLNCNIYNNIADEGDSIFNLGTLNVSYSNIQGGWEGEGNINADPLFFDPANGNFHLKKGSPCIDAGYPDPEKFNFDDLSPDDLDPDGTRKDIGAFYYDQTPITKEIILYPGWNLISLPVIPDDNNLNSIFPDIDTAYKYEHKFGDNLEYLESDYTKVDKLEPGIGYWLKSSIQKKYTLTGLAVKKYSLVKEYSEGQWHLLGGLTDIFQVEAKFEDRIQGIYRYTNGRYESIENNQVESGIGFWIWLSEN